jgi:hypothetical protein
MEKTTLQQIHSQVISLIEKSHNRIILDVYQVMIKNHPVDYYNCKCELCKTQNIYMALKKNIMLLKKYESYDCEDLNQCKEKLLCNELELKELKNYRKELRTI